MSIASRITSIEGHIGDIYDSVELTGIDTTDIDKNLINVPNTLKEGYIDIINNGTDTLYNNFPKVSGEGTSLTLNNTYQAPMRNNLKGNTSQTGTPTPTSPIPVNVVSGDNAITISNQGGTDSNTYNIDLPVENLFDGTIYKENYVISSTGAESYNSNFNLYKMNLKPNTTYTIQFKSTDTVARSSRYIAYKSNDTFIEMIFDFTYVANESVTKTFTTPNETSYILFHTGKLVENIQVEQGTKANSFTPYGTTPIELCKIGTYQDYFYKDSDKWYLHKEIGKVVLNGTETISSYAATSLSGSYQATFEITTKATSTDKIVLSDYFTTALLSDRTTKTNICYTYTDGLLRIATNLATTMADFKAWLSTHNVVVYYVLATPVNTALEDM